MSRRLLSIVAINLLVFCVLAELLALAYYYVQHGTLFYTNHVSRERVGTAEEQNRLTGEALHPYFGPTHEPGQPFNIPGQLREPGTPPPDAKTNNFGFVSAYDYPFRKANDRQFILGMFGGSVGVWFCELGAPRLVDALQRDPFFRDKEIVPLCFSHEGYKQPQQLLVLAYFLSIGQPFDLVLNIDGLNEVALGALNDEHGLDFSMPSVQHIDPLINLIDQATLTPDKLRSLTAIEDDKARINSLADRIDRTRIAAVDFVLEQLYDRAQNAYARELGRFSNLPSKPSAASLVRVTPRAPGRVGSTLYQDIAQNWVSASVLMNQMLAARRIPFVHVLQPNQYASGRKFSPAEAAVALSDASPFKKPVERGYPDLRAASAALKPQVSFLDATGAFDREEAAMYMDNCCHYTLAGNRRLADVIAPFLLSRLHDVGQ